MDLSTLSNDSIHAAIAVSPKRGHSPMESQETVREWSSDVLRVLRPGAHMVVVLRGLSHREMVGLEDSGFEIRDCLMYLCGGLICMPLLRKPLGEDSIVENILEWKTGGINLDDCRIPTNEDTSRDPSPQRGFLGEDFSGFLSEDSMTGGGGHEEGRYPPNVILNETVAKEMDERVGERPGARSNSHNPDVEGKTVYGTYDGTDKEEGYDDSGGPSRFFFTGDFHDVLEWCITLISAEGQTVLSPFGNVPTDTIKSLEREPVVIE